MYDPLLSVWPGVTFPSGEMQQRLVCSLYQQANISPEQVEYIEAHGTGTKVRTGSPDRDIFSARKGCVH